MCIWAVDVHSFPLCAPDDRYLYRSLGWWNHVVLQTFTDDDRIMNFRLSKATFYYLCEKLRPVIECQKTKCIWLFLWYTVLQLLFGVLQYIVSIGPLDICMK